jgi:hypothetical protein
VYEYIEEQYIFFKNENARLIIADKKVKDDNGTDGST